VIVKKFVLLMTVKVLALIALIGVVVYTMMPASAAELKPFEGTTPALSLNTLQGEAVDLEQYKGKLVMVQFWATYCTPCRIEMPSMNRLQTRLGENFVILAVDMGEEAAEVQQFVDEVKPEFTILMDEDGSALAAWKVFAAPATFIVDPAGKIQYTMFGATEWDSDEMVAELKNLM
jgi:thiol-disulfide isomerase/thioredoxin